MKEGMKVEVLPRVNSAIFSLCGPNHKAGPQPKLVLPQP